MRVETNAKVESIIQTQIDLFLKENPTQILSVFKSKLVSTSSNPKNILPNLVIFKINRSQKFIIILIDRIQNVKTICFKDFGIDSTHNVEKYSHYLFDM